MACSRSGLVTQPVEQRWSKSKGRGFESHHGQSFSLASCGPITLPQANAQEMR